ncbi:type II restriction endonuclease (plasmid) [Staphylococcus aureus]|uniref:type II restriction endonuclease n=1 Tax=Staphylococcus TaxID=1279 RepID=UPI0018897892|nr:MULTISPECIES: type II restriction endonuclease [Staphylococcus]MBF2782790.1 type II restriction endonuclease [Staphylococcus saprophyticus]UXU38087.1 type II restriction endonuclease [Staphylococcus aureus]
MKERNFEEWINHFKSSIADYKYYVDFEKVKLNVNKIKIELNILNSLIGEEDIENKFLDIVQKYPETLKCIPILLAIRQNEISIKTIDKDDVFNFKKPNHSPEEYAVFMAETGLFDLIQNHLISNLYDYVTGVESGLDSNGRKNRGGHLMEDLVEEHIKLLNVKYYKELRTDDLIKKYDIDLSAITNQGKTIKRFDFVIPYENKIFAIETNFYQSGGSKLNETARSFKNIAISSESIPDFEFVWITDGRGWKSAKSNLAETFSIMEHLYSIKDLQNGALKKMLCEE